MSDRDDRAVTGLLGAGVLACAVAALALRPAPLPASDAARWESLAAWHGGPAHVFGRSWVVDTLAVGVNRQPFADQTIPFHRGERFGAAGWALDPRTRRPAAAVLERLDGGPWRPARYHIARPDVLSRIGPGTEASGFEATVETGGLAPGRHELELATAGQGGPIRMTPPLPFVVLP